MVKLWRLTISTDAEEGSDPRQFCIENSICGVGWKVQGLEDGSEDRDRYWSLGKEVYAGMKGFSAAANAVGWNISRGDMCWTRDWDGAYYLGRITGEFVYHEGREWDRNDIHATRTCSWEKIGLEDSVPGDVKRSFISRSAVQQVQSESALAYSEFVLAKSAGKELPARPKSLDIVSLLGPDELEDAVALYLGIERGWFVVPSTAKRGTPTYEFVLRNSDGGRAVVQVKSGGAELPNLPMDFDANTTFFLFVERGEYPELPGPNFEVIERDRLEEFIRSNEKLMTPMIQQYVEMTGP